MIGVLNRVEQLADREPVKLETQGYIHKFENRIPFYSLVPLDEVVAKAFGSMVTSKKVIDEYQKLIRTFGGEFNILMETPIDEMKSKVHEKVVKGIEAIRRGEIRFDPPGYDGEYGRMVFLNEGEIKDKELQFQKKLF